MQDERIIELIAKSLDEPLSPGEQAEVNQAMQNSLAVRLTADSLREFDGLLKRTHMAIPTEGFPARVLARLEVYERHRARAQWLITVALIFLGSLAAIGWLIANYSGLLETIAQIATTLITVVPVWFNALRVLMSSLDTTVLLAYALLAVLLTALWARASGGTLTLNRARH
jgi:hypothetical protein